jgi:hypothetical protein
MYGIDAKHPMSVKEKTQFNQENRTNVITSRARGFVVRAMESFYNMNAKIKLIDPHHLGSHI